MDDEKSHSGLDLRAKLLTTSESVSGTATMSTIGGRNGLDPKSQLSQRKRKRDARGDLAVIGNCGEDDNTDMMTDIDEVNGLFTADQAPKRTRFTGNVALHPKTNSSTQHTPHQEAALMFQQVPPAPQQRLLPISQPTLSFLAQDTQEQSRQIHRILTCPPDAYFDILSLANGTDRLSLVEMSWLDLSYLVHPRRCSFPEAVKALCRVNDAYSWIQKHPGVPQPHVPVPSPPKLAQDVTSAPNMLRAPSTPAKRITEGPQQPRVSASTQNQPTQQQSEFRRGTARPIFREMRIEAPKPTSNVSSTQTRPALQQPESHPTPRLNPSTHRAIKKEPYSWNISGSQTHPATQQPPPQSPESRPHGQTTQLKPSGYATKELSSPESPSTKTHDVQSHSVHWKYLQGLDLAPNWEYPARRSSHVYSINGKPTIRPAVGWQFRNQGGETMVWWDRRWRKLIQGRPGFEGVHIDEEGWIMPILSGYMSERMWTRAREQAEFEFNNHP